MPNDINLNSVIEFSKVSKKYPEETGVAIHDVTFSVQPGEFVCIVGPSGCGKSTVLNLIAGLIIPTSGLIKRPEIVAMSFQSGALFPWLTVFENISLGLSVKRIPEATLRKEVAEQLDVLKLQEFSDKYPADLSGGQRQRVGIARALAVHPSILLLDEPFSALDAKTTAELHDDIIALWRKTDITIVMISHIIEEAVSLADRVLLMKNGTLHSTYTIDLPYPRREQEIGFARKVSEIRKDFFA
jgi:NitT/TauT family transport system ATP-binding protein